MENDTIYNDRKLDAFLSSHTAGEDEVLKRARERAAEEDMPPLSPDAASVLAFIARLSKVNSILEVGSGAGVSAVWLLRACPEARLTTIEIDPEHQNIACETYREAEISDRITKLLGDAKEVLINLNEKEYDMILIDTAKTDCMEYLAHSKRLCKIGGLIVFDNVWWSGRAFDPTAQTKEDLAVKMLNRAIVDDCRLDSIIIPIGDGISVSRLIF